MPIYEFRCEKCDQQFEILVRGQEKISCPECQDHRVERLLSAHATSNRSLQQLPMSCPPPSAGPCGPGCCRLP